VFVEFTAKVKSHRHNEVIVRHQIDNDRVCRYCDTMVLHRGPPPESEIAIPPPT
jgi:hypothetical protein